MGIKLSNFLRLINDSYKFLQSQHIAYVFVYHGVTSLKNTPQPMQLCFYFTLSAKNFSNESFPGFPLSFKEKPGMPIIFLTQIQLLLICFVRSQPNYLKLFSAKKDPVKYSILMIVFVILKVETKGPSDVLVTFYKKSIIYF